MSTYKLIWDDYCSWFLEMVKPGYGEPMDSKTYKSIIAILEDNLKILHPFMPFVTEEIWQEITDRTPEEALIIAKWPEEKDFNETIIKEFSHAAEVIAGVRKIRKDKNISFKNEIDLKVFNNENTSKTFDSVISKMGNISHLEYVNKSVDGALSFRVKSNEYFIPIVGAIDVDAEKKKIEEELSYTEGFLKSVDKKLSNERFVNNAPEKVVAIEKAKKADAEAKIEALRASLKSLN
jgi:valyl-tRNA synthetase